jgi:methylated-DNA-[protein]-cysteine S-methyltransferase
MINVTAERRGSLWYGIAWYGQKLVATAVRATRIAALQRVARCIPSGVATRTVEDAPPSIAEIVTMLGELESGNEEHKRYTLSKEYLSSPMYRIYSVAAAIPIGYVTTYGGIANAAGSEARAVGRAMATNPFYPVVPCHRVVGADMALVGYGGKQDQQALKAKLDRIAAELRGVEKEKEIAVDNGVLIVFPAEKVIHAVQEMERRKIEAGRRESEKAAADQQQLRLF